MYVAASALEGVDVLGPRAPFSRKPILVKLEGGKYVGPILPGPLSDLLAGKCAAAEAAAVAVAAAEVAAAAVKPKILGWGPLGGSQGCRCGTMRTFPPCHFGTGKTHGTSCK